MTLLDMFVCYMIGFMIGVIVSVIIIERKK